MLTHEDRQRRLKVFDLRLAGLIRQRVRFRHESEQDASVAVSLSREGQRIAARRELLESQDLRLRV
jgi:urease accessory protein UreE